MLFVVSAFFPSEGIRISDDITLVFAKPKEIFSNSEPQYANIDNIIALNTPENETGEEIVEEAIPIPVEVVEEIDTLPEIDTVRANAKKLKSSICRIEFPNNNREMLFPIFKAMENAQKKGKVVRIMHYGDSQIEGDRITSYVRYKLQSKFGGSGVGLLPVKHLYDFKFSIRQKTSDNWHRRTVYGFRDTTLQHNRYGILGNFSQFTPFNEEISTDDSIQHTAWVSFNESSYSYSNTKSFEQCRLFLGSNSSECLANLYISDTLVDSHSFQPDSSLQSLRWRFDEPVSNINIEFNANRSPEVYAVALDGKSGVAVDNIAMRGCSGLIFTKMNAPLYREMMKELDVGLIILQFGGNVVPQQSRSYNFYERWLTSHIKWIQRNVPNTPIILMGVADMSKKEKNYYVTYPSVKKVREAMKNAAKNTNIAYWDMYKAMGGENSMPSWVFAHPPLATKDFVHFNVRGARLMANMFYNAFNNEYQYYLKQKNKQ